MVELSLFVKIALSSALALFGILFSVLIIRWLVRALSVNADHFEILKLANHGNCACQYHLSVNSTATDLKFTLYDDGFPLTAVFEEIEEEVIDKKAEAKKEEVKPVAAKTTAANTGTQEATKTAKVDSEGAIKKGQDVSAKAGVFANFLGILGSILPGKMGSSVKGAAGGARNVQKKSAQAVQAPRSAQRKMDAMRKSSGRLGVNAANVQEAGVSQPGVGVRQMRGKQEQAESSRSTREIVKKVKKIVEKVGTVQTIGVDPGEVLYLALEISKKGSRYPTGTFGYSIESQPVPLDKRLGEAPPTMKTGQVHFAEIGFWRYYISPLGVILYLALLTYLAYLAVTYLWM